MAPHITSLPYQHPPQARRTSQGLGINYNYQPPTSPNKPLRSSNLTLPPVTNSLAPSPTRDRLPPQQQQQPQFSLRPTHSLTPSKQQPYSSFSAIPPSPSFHYDSDSRRSSTSSSPRRLPLAPGPAQSANIDFTRSPSAQSRAGSIVSSSSDSSKGQGGPRKMRSVDKLRNMARANSGNGGAYMPLGDRDAGNDNVQVMSQDSIPESPELHIPPVESAQPAFGYQDADVFGPSPSKQPPSSPPTDTASSRRSHRPLPRPRGPSVSSAHMPTDRVVSQGSISSIAPLLNTETPRSPDRESSSDEHIFYRGPTVPEPQVQEFPERPFTHLSDPEDDGRPRQPRHPQAMLMSRSLSQPADLGTVSERSSEYFAPSNDGNSSKRASKVSNGVHSQNAALLSAESGAMMLAFSPSGDSQWREGQPITGPQSGLIPTPQMPQGMRAPNEDPESELMSRPWSESSMSHGHFGNVQQIPAPPSNESSFLRHRRSHSEDSNHLARQGTLFYPSGSTQRASQELGVMLGGRSRRLSDKKILPPPPQAQWEHPHGASEQVRLEASKKRKARVEVDVVLERDCIVEGGDVRGRMEVRVTGGKRSEGLRVGGGKVRIIGFEEIGTSSRHIFYNHPHMLPLFHDLPPEGRGSTLFASGPDDEGYYLAAEGSHAIPFKVPVPLNGGAKGCYTSPNGKGPCVRYVIVVSLKIHVTSNGKRSIAHFYRPIVVLPYLNPALVLAPSVEPIQARHQGGLGWSIGGDKGQVEVRVGLGRRAWVSGQRIWCQIGITNYSTRKIKSLHIALLQTVQTFNPQPALGTSGKVIDFDACQTSTTRRKVNEEIVEADSDHGAGRVTGRGWWMGVEPGGSGVWDMSILSPSGMISIRRTRLIEVLYNLRVTVNNSIYVDIPVTLINFLSIDPPPMPGDGARLLNMQPVQAPAPAGPIDFAQPMHSSSASVVPGAATLAGPYDHIVPLNDASHRGSMEHLDNNPAKASSTTLHLDAMLRRSSGYSQPGSANEGPKEQMPSFSEHNSDQHAASVDRMKSVNSVRSVWTGESESSITVHGDDADDQFAAARAAIGRQRSLVVVNGTDNDDSEDEQEVVKSPNTEEKPAESVDGTHEGTIEDDKSAQTFKPEKTPTEVAMPIMDNPLSAQSSLSSRPKPTLADPIDTSYSPIGRQQEFEDEKIFAENGMPYFSGEYGGYDYADEDDQDETTPQGQRFLPRRPSSGLPLPAGAAEHGFNTGGYKEDAEDVDITLRGRNEHGSSGYSSAELGQESPSKLPQPRISVTPLTRSPQKSSAEPTPRRLSVAIPDSPSRQNLSPLAAGTRDPGTRAPLKKSSVTNLAASARQGISPRKSEDAAAPKVIQKKSSFSFATPGSPLKVKVVPKKSASPAGSPKGSLDTLHPATASIKSTGPKSPLGSLRQRAGPLSPAVSAESDYGPPGLSASDTASSTGGEEVESPPCQSFPATIAGPSPPTSSYSQAPDPGPFEYDSKSPTWSPGARMPNTFSYLHTDPHATHGFRSTATSEDDHSMTSHETSNSILPGVQSRINRLESRNEALRRFSVAAVAGGSSANSSAPSSPPAMPTSPRKTPTSRKSYTTALGREGRTPRAVTTAPREDYPIQTKGELGGTTYIRPKVNRDNVMDFDDLPLDPFGIGASKVGSPVSTTSASSFDAISGKIRASPNVGSVSSIGSVAGAKAGLGGMGSPRVTGNLRVPSTVPAGDSDSSEGLQ